MFELTLELRGEGRERGGGEYEITPLAMDGGKFQPQRSVLAKPGLWQDLHSQITPLTPQVAVNLP